VKQTFEKFEVIVSDDGSTDNTREIVSRYADNLKLKYIWNPNWGGPAKPRNLAAKLAVGDWLVFLDADDFWYPNKLQNIFPHLEHCDVIYHSLDCVFEDKIELITNVYKAKELKTGTEYIELLTYGNKLHNSGTAVRRSMFEQVSGFAENKNIVACEDYDLWLRLASQKARFKALRESLGVYVFSKNNDQISSPSPKFIHAIETVFDIHLVNIPQKLRNKARGFKSYTVGMMHMSAKNSRYARKAFLYSLRHGALIVKLKSLVRLLTLNF
jgi:glycosyltransferase involved in cell wall biosynthesis